MSSLSLRRSTSYSAKVMPSSSHSMNMQRTRRFWLFPVDLSLYFLYGSKGSLEFYFNFPLSILGELVPSVSSQSQHLPYRHFLATPLLPCGEADPKIKKFTGNDQIGTAEDHMTQAIHAFAHFSVIYSQKNLLFCDLQGMSARQATSYFFEIKFRCSGSKEHHVSH